MKQKYLMAAALAASPLLGMSSAWASPCVTAPVATYTASGFSCTVGILTFSSFTVSTTATGSGSVALGSFSPFDQVISGVTEQGLSLSYSSNTGSTANSHADIAWTYNVAVTAPPPSLTDAYMSFAGTTTGTGTATLAETLSNGATLALDAPGATSTSFAPTTSLSVIKDQNDFSGASGSAETSLLVNAFSTGTGPTPTPEPTSLVLLGTACLGLGAFMRFRRRV